MLLLSLLLALVGLSACRMIFSRCYRLLLAAVAIEYIANRPAAAANGRQQPLVLCVPPHSPPSSNCHPSGPNAAAAADDYLRALALPCNLLVL